MTGVPPSGSGHSAEPEPISVVSAETASVPNAAQVIDGWCKDRARILTERSNRYILSGGDIDAPDYRALWGEHRAYSAVRSFIHGSRLASAMSAFGQDPEEGLEAKPASAVPNGETPS